MSIQTSRWNSETSRPLDGVRQFFFAEEVPYGLALTRILLPMVLLIDVIRRWFHARELFSTDGAIAQLATNYGYYDFLPEFSGGVVVVLYTALIFFLLSSIAGWFTRFSLFAATILYTYFTMLDCLSTITKYTVISSHVMLLLSLSPAGLIWSVDSWLKGRRSQLPFPAGGLPTAVAWQRRLIQLLVGIVYFGAAITKIHTPEYFSGDQMQLWMMTYVNHKHPFGDYLTQFPGILVMFAYVVVVWEILFIACAWKGVGRLLLVGLGAVFHFMTWLSLGLIIFPMVMMCTYLSFLNEQDMQWIARMYRRVTRKLGLARVRPAFAARLRGYWPTQPVTEPGMGKRAAAFGLALGLFAVAGVELEYWLDLYGQRRPQGRYTLEKIPEQQVRTMLHSNTPLRISDMFLSFDVGDVAFGGRLWNSRREFLQGERIIAETSLIPPHADMWVECNLHDSKDRLINRVGQIVPREKFRAFYNYRLDDSFNPGKYFLVLKSRGQEIMRREITLLPPGADGHDEQIQSPVAN